MQDSKTNKSEERARYWREILSRATEYPGSDNAFCKQEGIKKSNFYHWKRKLTQAEGKKRGARQSSPFVAVQVASPRANPQMTQKPIDAKWVAELIMHLHAGAAK